MNDPRVAPAAARFGDVADAYERARPLYPDAALAELAARGGLGAGSVVLDLGAGTGKLTRQLAASGANVIAVEPSPGMRGRLAHAAPGGVALDGTAEDIPLAAASVDVVAAGPAFHWFRTRPALDEDRRAHVLDEIRAFLATHRDTARRGELTYDRPCSLHLCRRLA